MTQTKCNVAVLISGKGSNLQALIDAASAGDYPAKIALVVSNRSDAYGLERARKANIPARVLPHKDYKTREAFDEALHHLLLEYKVELICLAGFMRLLTPAFVKRWEGRVINIHPSLLPAYKGLHTHRRVLEAQEKWSGCTVHFVTPELDDGPIILQKRVEVLKGDTEETLAARVLELEHQIYPQALRILIEGKR